MCGIAGCMGRVDEATVARMLARQAHRGPDDAGLWSTPADQSTPATLGHRRLAVLDPTSAGHQPMADASGRLRVVFNGELYNFHAVARELAGKGYRFETRSDTEVLLAAYHAWGPACVGRFAGMFAFAL